MDLKKLYITSDLHFMHKNIIKYCNRPYDFSWEGVSKMNYEILDQFDELPKGATIINNGDIALNSSLTFDKLKEFVDKMKRNDKKLWLILGNHDREMTKRIKEFNKYETPTDLFLDAGFDRVFPYPILLEEKYLLSHEPVYLKPGSNLINLYGHTHDLDIDENYFNRDCENWAMMERVKEQGITEQTNLDIDTSIKPFGKLVDVNNYKNMCWDKHHRILKFEEIM